jgi:hypothetical protein
MSGVDGTGPTGRGSGTGRAKGFCSGADTPDFASTPGRGGFRQGFGQGTPGRVCGRGMGPDAFRGAWRQDPMGAGPVGPTNGVRNLDMERQDLQHQAKAMQSALDAINQRLSRLENQTPHK